MREGLLCGLAALREEGAFLDGAEVGLVGAVLVVGVVLSFR